MSPSDRFVRRRRCRAEEIGLVDQRDRGGWPESEALLASVGDEGAAGHLLAFPEISLAGQALTTFLNRVAPFGCPEPPSLIRAYSLPDAPFPSILLKEHEEAPDGTGDAYRRFNARARQRWLTALDPMGPGLFPIVAWTTGPARRFLDPAEWSETLAQLEVVSPGAGDDYLGRGLLLLADPDLAAAWPAMMSLGGPTKARKITGREFPVWVDLAAHQPSLLASPLLARVERLLAAA